MASFKSHPFFFTSLILAGALTAGQAWLIFSQRSAAGKIETEIEQKRQTLQGFATSRPFPSKMNLEAVEADLAAINTIRAEISGRLRAGTETAAKISSATVPASPTDAYFDIANFIERTKAKAAAAQIDLGADNRFGFSAYRSTGPERDLIPAVFKQRLYVEYLSDALIKAKPGAIVGIQRELPLTAAQKQQVADAVASGMTPPVFGGGGGGSSGAEGDYFVIDPQISARREGFVETIPLRVTFVGFTESLRTFLNELVSFQVPVVVRSVEVAPANAANNSGGQSAARPKANTAASIFDGVGAADGGPAVVQDTAIVPRSESRFTVTVEIISLAEKTNPDAEAASAPTP